MKEVTDPNILAQLNTPNTGQKEVTDPNILAQLNSGASQQPMASSDWFIPESRREQKTDTSGSPSYMMGTNPMQTVPVGPVEREEWRTMAQPIISDQLGAPFDFQKGISDFGTRFDAARSTNPEEVRLKLTDKYPDADVRMLSGFGDSPVPVMRRQGEPAFYGVDEPGASMGDVADVAGAITTPDTLAGIVAAIMSRGASLPIRAAIQGAAGFAGDLANSGIEEARGFQTDPLGDLLQQAGLAGLFGAAGEGLGSKIGTPKGGILTPGEGVINAEQAATNLDLPPITMGQSHPLSKRKENQAAMTSGKLRDVYVDQEKGMGDVLKRNAEGSGQDIDDAQLEDILRSQLDDLRSGMNTTNVSTRKGGKGIQTGVGEFKDTSRKWVGRKYDKALSDAEGAAFNIEDAQGLGREYSAGVQSKGRDVTDIVETGILDEAGEPILKDVTTEGKGVNVTSNPEGRFSAALKRLNDIDPNIEDFKGKQSAEILKSLRTEFGDLGQYGPSNLLPDTQQSQARKIYKKLSDALDEPTGGSEGFKQSWKSAQKAYKFRRGVLDRSDIKTLAKADNAYETGKKFAQPGQFENLRVLKRTIGKDKWDNYKESYKTSLLNDPNPVSKLKAWDKDPDGLNLLLTPAEKREFKSFAYAAERINKGPVKAVLANQTDTSKRVFDLLKSGDNKTLVKMVTDTGGPTSKTGRNFRASVSQAILDESSVIKDGIKRPDPKKLIASISNYIDGGKLKGVLLPADIKALDDLRTYASIIGRKGDVGAGMQGGEITAQLFDIFNPVRSMKGLSSVLNNAMYARILTSPKASKLVFGSGKRGAPKTTVRAAAITVSSALEDLLQSVDTDVKEPE